MKHLARNFWRLLRKCSDYAKHVERPSAVDYPIAQREHLLNISREI